MSRTSYSLVALVVCLASTAGCNATTGEGVSGCNGNGDCPGAFPVCRADMRCWSTPDPGTDAAIVDGAVRDGGGERDGAVRDAGSERDGAAHDAASVGDSGGGGVDSGGSDVDSSVPPTDGAVPGGDSGPTGDAGPGTDGGPGSDGGGPCGGGPTTVFYRDADGDAHGAVASGTMMRCAAGGGYVASNDDCDDANAATHPGAAELCNGVDDDCAGGVDGAAASATCVVSGGTGVCAAGACDIASCTAPLDDCDAVVATGCETNTATSGAHCGSCGAPCGAADTCSASVCAGSPVVQVEPAAYNACLRRANGHVACWGQNHVGALGTGSTTPASSATPLEIPGIADAIDIAVTAAGGGACVVRTGGAVVCWGNNGTTSNLGLPGTGIMGPGTVAGIADAVEIDYGYNTICARRSTGRVACWGPGAAVANMTGLTDAVHVDAVDDDSFCAVRATGAVVCWGPLLTATPATPVSMSAVTTATRVALRAGAACIMNGSGGMSCYAIGPGSGDFNPMPGVTTAAQISGGSSTLCARLTGGTTVCFGANPVGQLGNGATNPTYSPVPTAPSGSPAAAYIGSGSSATCIATTTGTVRCWGDTANHYINSLVPILVPGL